MMSSKENDTISVKKRSRPCFDWIQLLAAICIPVLIAIYTIVANESNSSIAADSRDKDIRIAEQRRDTDRELALDQQHQTILIEYQTFLARLLLENGLLLSEVPSAKTVGRFMTLTALTQLDPQRKSFLLRSLYESNLIVLQEKCDVQDQSVLLLERADLTDVTLGTPRNSREDELKREHFIVWSYVYFVGATMTNASFRHVKFDCGNFKKARLDSVDFSFSFTTRVTCFDIYRGYDVDFSGTSLVDSNFYRGEFVRADFDWVNMTSANLTHFRCEDCSFYDARFIQTKMNFATFTYLRHEKRGISFASAQFQDTTAHAVVFRTARLTASTWFRVNAREITLDRCLLTWSVFINCSFAKGYFEQTSFVDTELSHIDLSYSTLLNVTFRGAQINDVNFSSIECHRCDFQNVTFNNCIWHNSTFRYSDFLHSNVLMEQLQHTFDLTESILPSGTRFEKHIST